MSINSKEVSKNKISKKLNNTDNKGKLFSKKNQIHINLISSENNDSNSLENKFFSDNSINNDKKINCNLLEKEKEEIKNNNKKEKSINKSNNELLLENKKSIIKENEEKEENNIIKINKEEEEKELNEKNNKNNEKINELNNEIKKEKNILKPDEIILDIKKDKTNLELMQEKNNELENKLKNLLSEIKNEENNSINTKKECENKISQLNVSIKKQTEINKKVIKDISKLQKELNVACDKLIKYFSKNKNNFYNQTKTKIEKQLKVKESQCNYNQKVTLLLMKEINKYNKTIESNSMIDENIKQENPLINKKEEEYRFILNKLNEEIDTLKQDIQELKKIKNKHIMCSKIEQKLLNEIEFYKIEKQKKLNYIESLNKYKYLQNLRKRKILIEREQFNNLSSNNILTGLKIPIDLSKFENSFLKNEIENNNEMTTIVPVKRIVLKKLGTPLTVSNSSRNINMFEKAKRYEQDKLAVEENNNNKNTLKEKYYINYSGVFGLFPNQLFTDEEKAVIKNYQFIPQEKVDIYEKKYTNLLEQINRTEKKIKNLGKLNEQKRINIKCKIVSNERKQKEQEKISFSNSLIIKQNMSRILKMKSLIKEKNKEEKEVDLDLKKQNLKYEQLKQILGVSKNFEKLTSINDIDDENKEIIDLNITNKSNNDNNINQIKDQGETINEESNKENDLPENIIKN